MSHSADYDAVREVLRERLCGFEDDGNKVIRVELLGSLDEIAEAITRVLSPAECLDFGCDGNGRQAQGWTDKNGHPEDQYGECSRPCGRPTPPAESHP